MSEKRTIIAVETGGEEDTLIGFTRYLLKETNPEIVFKTTPFNDAIFNFLNQELPDLLAVFFYTTRDENVEITAKKLLKEVDPQMSIIIFTSRILDGGYHKKSGYWEMSKDLNLKLDKLPIIIGLIKGLSGE